MSFTLLEFQPEEGQKILKKGEVGHQQNWIWFCKTHGQVAKHYTDYKYSDVLPILLLWFTK